MSVTITPLSSVVGVEPITAGVGVLPVLPGGVMVTSEARAVAVATQTAGAILTPVSSRIDLTLFAVGYPGPPGPQGPPGSGGGGGGGGNTYFPSGW